MKVGARRPFKKIAVTSTVERALKNTISLAISLLNRLIIFIIISGISIPR